MRLQARQGTVRADSVPGRPKERLFYIFENFIERCKKLSHHFDSLVYGISSRFFRRRITASTDGVVY